MTDGKGCECFARCEADCVCDADWTPEEVIRLRADIERHIAIASEHATECERLRAELAECRDALAKIGPYYVPSTELSDDEVNAMYAMIDTARKGEGE